MPVGVGNFAVDLQALEQEFPSSCPASLDLKCRIFGYIGFREPTGLVFEPRPSTWHCPKDEWWAQHAFSHWGGGSYTAASPLTGRVYELAKRGSVFVIHDEFHGRPPVSISLPLSFPGLAPFDRYLDHVAVVGDVVYLAVTRQMEDPYTAVVKLEGDSYEASIVCSAPGRGCDFDVIQKDHSTLRVMMAVLPADLISGLDVPLPPSGKRMLIMDMPIDGSGPATTVMVQDSADVDRDPVRFISPGTLFSSPTSLFWPQAQNPRYDPTRTIRCIVLTAVDGAKGSSVTGVVDFRTSCSYETFVASPSVECCPSTEMPRGLSNLTIDLAAVSSVIPLNLKGVKDIKYMISQYIGRREPRTLKLAAVSGNATRADDLWWCDNALKHPPAIADPLTRLHYDLDVCELSGCGHLLIYAEEDDQEVMLGACLSEKGIGGHEDMATGVVDKLVLLDDRFYVGLANFDDKTTEFKELTRVDLKIRDLATLKRVARNFSVTRKSDSGLRIGVMAQNKRPLEPYNRPHDDQDDTSSDTDSPFEVTEIHIKDEGSDWVAVPTWPLLWSPCADMQFVTPDVILLDDRAPCYNGKQRSNLTLLRLFTDGEPRVEELSRLKLDCWPSACLLSPCGMRIKVYVNAQDEDYDVQICY